LKLIYLTRISTTNAQANAPEESEYLPLDISSKRSKRKSANQIFHQRNPQAGSKSSAQYSKLSVLDNKINLPPLLLLPKHPYHSGFQMLDVDLDKNLSIETCPNIKLFRNKANQKNKMITIQSTDKRKLVKNVDDHFVHFNQIACNKKVVDNLPLIGKVRESEDCSTQMMVRCKTTVRYGS
jgi:hypothetical protein